MSAPAGNTPAVDPTLHRPSRTTATSGMCEYCGPLEGDTAQHCPGWLEHRATQVYRVEGWEYNAWTMMSGAKATISDAELRMAQLKARFPETPMRVVAETTSFMVLRTAPGQTPPTDGDQMT